MLNGTIKEENVASGLALNPLAFGSPGRTSGRVDRVIFSIGPIIIGDGAFGGDRVLGLGERKRKRDADTSCSGNGGFQPLNLKLGDSRMREKTLGLLAIVPSNGRGWKCRPCMI
ncbi:TonB-dependent receptor [Sesbania bispinosa]|nr:TonB-dependent receptor [Sesbania bispinosa]